MKKHIFVLITYLLIFALVFGLSVFNYIYNRPTLALNMGFSPGMVNLILMGLSTLAIIKSAWHIISA